MSSVKSKAGAKGGQPEAGPLTGGRKAVLGLVGAGLALTLFSSYAYRMEHPSLTVPGKGESAQQAPGEGGQGMGAGQTPGGPMGGMGSMGQVRELMTRVEQDPKDFHAMVDLGDIFLSMGANDRALKYLEQAHELNPEDVDIVQRLGLTRFQMKNYPEAAQYFEAVIAKDPNNALAHFNLGVVNRHYLNNEAKAAEHFKKATELPTDDAELAAKAKEEAAKGPAKP